MVQWWLRWPGGNNYTFLVSCRPNPLAATAAHPGGEGVMYILLIAYHKLIGGLKNGIAHVAQGLQSVKFLSL